MQGILKQIKFAGAIAHAKITKKYAPLQMQISLTNKCNLRCSYCYALYPERPDPDLSTEEIKDLISQMAALGTKRINLVGGEPLMRKDIGEIISHIKKFKIECAMTTNGYFVPHKIEQLKSIDLVCISLDGAETAHDINRGKGSYKRAMEAIRELKKNGIRFQISAVLNKNSIPDFYSLLKMGQQEGFSVGFTTLLEQTQNGVKNAPPDLPTDQEYREILDKIIEWKRQGLPVLFSEKVIRYARDWKHGFAKDKIMHQQPDHKYIRCNAGKHFGIMDVNGDIYPCPATVDVLKVKNARKEGMAKAFSHINNHPCKTCHIPCQNEFSRMYDFDLGVIKNILKNYRSGNS